jgi:hypothetical protein
MNDGPDVELWATAISRNSLNGRRIVFRYAKEFRADFDRSTQPDRIIIAWKYLSESGQPSPGEYQEMNQLEDALQGVLQENGSATLVLVSTGENLHEWTYYAKSVDGFSAMFDRATAQMHPFPIEVYEAHDPTWRMYEKFRTENPET